MVGGNMVVRWLVGGKQWWSGWWEAGGGVVGERLVVGW